MRTYHTPRERWKVDKRRCLPSLTNTVELRNWGWGTLSHTHTWHLSKWTETINTDLKIRPPQNFLMSRQFSLLLLPLLQWLSRSRENGEGFREFEVLGHNSERKEPSQGKTQQDTAGDCLVLPASFNSNQGHLILNHTFRVFFLHPRERKGGISFSLYEHGVVELQA